MKEVISLTFGHKIPVLTVKKKCISFLAKYNAIKYNLGISIIYKLDNNGI